MGARKALHKSGACSGIGASVSRREPLWAMQCLLWKGYSLYLSVHGGKPHETRQRHPRPFELYVRCLRQAVMTNILLG